MDLLGEFDRRRLIHDSTDRAALGARLAEAAVGVYIGFDPTADSLHVGHLMGQISLRRFQLAGHRPFPLAGGATGMVGDPGGKSEERNLLDRETLTHNVECITRQLERILDFEPGPYRATLVDNAEWTSDIRLLDFLRDVGKLVTVNQMIAKESVKARLGGDSGISYTEFSYMLLQANDFRHLHREFGVELQIGGSDQWGNIVSGIDLIRRSSGAQVHGLTWPLLLKSDGSKFGKTASGAVWLDATKTSPYQFRQFWVQTDDEQIGEMLLRFSLRPVDEVEAIVEQHHRAPERREAQRALADELTELVHGADAARSAAEVAAVLFGADPMTASAATFEAIAGEVASGTVGRSALEDLPGLLAAHGLAASKSEARRVLGGRGYRANGIVLEETTPLDEVPLVHDRFLLVRRGKTDYLLLEVAGH